MALLEGDLCPQVMATALGASGGAHGERLLPLGQAPRSGVSLLNRLYRRAEMCNESRREGSCPLSLKTTRDLRGGSSVFLPGGSRGQRSLADHGAQGLKEWDLNEQARSARDIADRDPRHPCSFTSHSSNHVSASSRERAVVARPWVCFMRTKYSDTNGIASSAAGMKSTSTHLPLR